MRPSLRSSRLLFAGLLACALASLPTVPAARSRDPFSRPVTWAELAKAGYREVFGFRLGRSGGADRLQERGRRYFSESQKRWIFELSSAPGSGPRQVALVFDGPYRPDRLRLLAFQGAEFPLDTPLPRIAETLGLRVTRLLGKYEASLFFATDREQVWLAVGFAYGPHPYGHGLVRSGLAVQVIAATSLEEVPDRYGLHQLDPANDEGLAALVQLPLGDSEALAPLRQRYETERQAEQARLQAAAGSAELYLAVVKKSGPARDEVIARLERETRAASAEGFHGTALGKQLLSHELRTRDARDLKPAVAALPPASRRFLSERLAALYPRLDHAGTPAGRMLEAILAAHLPFAELLEVAPQGPVLALSLDEGGQLVAVDRTLTQRVRERNTAALEAWQAAIAERERRAAELSRQIEEYGDGEIVIGERERLLGYLVSEVPLEILDGGTLRPGRFRVLAGGGPGQLGGPLRVRPLAAAHDLEVSGPVILDVSDASGEFVIWVSAVEEITATDPERLRLRNKAQAELAALAEQPEPPQPAEFIERTIEVTERRFQGMLTLTAQLEGHREPIRLALSAERALPPPPVATSAQGPLPDPAAVALPYRDQLLDRLVREHLLPGLREQAQRWLDAHLGGLGAADDPRVRAEAAWLRLFLGLPAEDGDEREVVWWLARNLRQPHVIGRNGQPIPQPGR